MDRNAQIQFMEGAQERVRSYVSKWLDVPAVREAVEQRPEPPPSTVELQRKFG